MDTTTLRIIPELERNLRALTDDEREHLEASILAEGCRDPIAVWDEERAILDGHNRHRICTEHGIPYEEVRVNLPSLEAALAWQVRNQFAKRNLTPNEIAYLRGKDYLASKQEHGGDRKSEESSGHFVHLKTGDAVAQRHGTTERTIRRDAGYAEAVDALSRVLGDEVRTKLLTGEGLAAPLSKQDVIDLAKTTEETPKVGETAAALLSGEQPNSANGRNPHGIRDPQIAILVARIRHENGALTYLQLFEEVPTVDTPLVRHDRAQLEYILSLAGKEPDEETALIVADVSGARYKIQHSLAQITYLLRVGNGGGLADEEMAECVKAVNEEGVSLYRAVWKRHRRDMPKALPLDDEAA
jgi:hypothetical protein